MSLWDWYFLTSIAVTVLILASPGTDINHLLEMEVAAALVIAQRLKAPAPDPVWADSPIRRLVLLLALVIGGYEALKNPDWKPNKAEGFWFWQQRSPTFAQAGRRVTA